MFYNDTQVKDSTSFYPSPARYTHSSRSIVPSALVVRGHICSLASFPSPLTGEVRRCRLLSSTWPRRPRAPPHSLLHSAPLPSPLIGRVAGAWLHTVAHVAASPSPSLWSLSTFSGPCARPICWLGHAFRVGPTQNRPYMWFLG
jgi:hypothetical protein